MHSCPPPLPFLPWDWEDKSGPVKSCQFSSENLRWNPIMLMHVQIATTDLNGDRQEAGSTSQDVVSIVWGSLTVMIQPTRYTKSATLVTMTPTNSTNICCPFTSSEATWQCAFWNTISHNVASLSLFNPKCWTTTQPIGCFVEAPAFIDCRIRVLHKCFVKDRRATNWSIKKRGTQICNQEAPSLIHCDRETERTILSWQASGSSSM